MTIHDDDDDPKRSYRAVSFGSSSHQSRVRRAQCSLFINAATDNNFTQKVALDALLLFCGCQVDVWTVHSCFGCVAALDDLLLFCQRFCVVLLPLCQPGCFSCAVAMDAWLLFFRHFVNFECVSALHVSLFF